MPKAMRYKHNGQYLQNTLFWTSYDYISAYHAQPDVFDADLATEEERLSIESHKQDYAIAFGIPAEEIEVEFIPWDGDESQLPLADDNYAPIERIPEEKREGYIASEPAPLTPFEQLRAILATDPSISPSTKQAIAAIGE